MPEGAIKENKSFAHTYMLVREMCDETKMWRVMPTHIVDGRWILGKG